MQVEERLAKRTPVSVRESEENKKDKKEKKGQEVLFFCSPHYLTFAAFLHFFPSASSPLSSLALPLSISLFSIAFSLFISFFFSFLPLKSLKDDLVTQFHCARESIAIILADSLDRPSLTALVASTHVVLSAAGPFSK